MDRRAATGRGARSRDHRVATDTTPDLSTLSLFVTTSPTASWLRTVVRRQVARGLGRFWRAVDFRPGDYGVEDGDGGHGDVPSGIISNFAAKAWWPTTAASDLPSLGTAPFVDLAARMRGYRRRQVRRENGRRKDDPEPVSHCRIHSAPRRPNTVSALGGRATEASCQSLSGIPVDTGVRFLCIADVRDPLEIAHSVHFTASALIAPGAGWRLHPIFACRRCRRRPRRGPHAGR